MSMMAPLRTPREIWCPMPAMLGRPSSATRAMKQHILLVPMSSAAIRPLRGATRVFLIMLPCPLPCRRPGRRNLRGFGRMRPAQHHLVRQAQIDDAHVLFQEAVLVLQVGEARPGRRRILLRQLHVDAVVEAQVPAPLADEHGGGDAILAASAAGQQVEQGFGALRRVVAHDHQQLGVFAEVGGLDHLAGAADQKQLLAALPQRHRLGFLDRHQQPVGIAPLDLRRHDPGQGGQPLAHRIDVERRAAARRAPRRGRRGCRPAGSRRGHALRRSAG